jgi:Protein of unknown function (DUF2971)
MPIGAAIADAQQQATAIASKFAPLYKRFLQADIIQRKKPLLAHYTSLEAAEQILKNHEVWFSNPLFMNDWEEMRFGIQQGVALLQRTTYLRDALKADERVSLFGKAFTALYEQLDKVSSLDVYVFCLSEHPRENNDGILSMWRGYGGLGRGTALVFDTAELTFVDGAPMYICKVDYGNAEERIATLDCLVREWVAIVKDAEIPDTLLSIPAHNLLNLFTFYALTSKHIGFMEENEWRVIHLGDLDPQKRLADRFQYALGPQGVEPKLKFKFERHSAGNYPEKGMSDLLSKIILGPSVSSPLAKMAFRRMLKSIGREIYSERVVASTIPLRPAHTAR